MTDRTPGYYWAWEDNGEDAVAVIVESFGRDKVYVDGEPRDESEFIYIEANPIDPPDFNGPTDA